MNIDEVFFKYPLGIMYDLKNEHFLFKNSTIMTYAVLFIDLYVSNFIKL